jgi:hypothetical protein
MTSRAQALVLYRIIRRPAPATLHSRETELRLSDDGRYVTLSRYVERFGDTEAAWCVVRHHRVPVLRIIRWMISSGIVQTHSETGAPKNHTLG